MALGILLLVSVLLGEGLLLATALLLALATLVSQLWGRYCLSEVKYERRLSQHRAFCGEELELTVEITNAKPLPLGWLEVRDELPSQLRVLNASTTSSHLPLRDLLTFTISLLWYQKARRRYRLRCEARGYHEFGPVRLRSGDPFGLTSRQVVGEQIDHVLVYPKVMPLAALGLPARHPFGEQSLRGWMFLDPMRVAGVREYRPGDSLRRIHWKASARTQQLQSRLLEPSFSPRLMVFLNLNTYGSAWWWQGHDPELLELAIITAASVANWAVQAGQPIGLCANGNLRMAEDRVTIPANRDPEQLVHVLEALARILPFATVSIADLLRQEATRLPYGATVVVVSATVESEMLSALLALQRLGHPAALLLIGDVEAPRLPGLIVHRVSTQPNGSELEELRLA